MTRKEMLVKAAERGRVDAEQGVIACPYTQPSFVCAYFKERDRRYLELVAAKEFRNLEAGKEAVE